jgi:hypothetical protein
VAQVTATSDGPGSWRVEVDDDDGRTTSHLVRVPDDLVAELGLATDREADLVRESFYFLLAREPATSIMSEFSLDVIGQYFPEYREEIGATLG